MKTKDILSYAFRGLADRKLRAVLTIIGIVIGPATIVALVGATQGYSASLANQLDTLGATSVFVTPVGRGLTLTARSLPQVQDLPDVAHVVPYIELGGSLKEGTTTLSVQVIALNLSQLGYVFPSLRLSQGSIPAAFSTIDAVVGSDIANPGVSGAVNLSIGSVVTLSGVGRGFAFGFSPVAGGATAESRSFIVSGIFRSVGAGLFIDPDQAVFVQTIAGEAILGSEDYSGLIVVASSAASVSNVVTELQGLYGNQVHVTAASSVASTVQSAAASTTVLLEAVSGTSIIVAFVGIMTTMLTSVVERTREIGILKALGATRRNILLIFVFEAVIIGLIGGLVGAAAGSGVSYLIIPYLGHSVGIGGVAGRGFARAAVAPAASIQVSPRITPELLLGAVGLAAAVGLLGGVIPAWRASRLQPVEALGRL